MKLIENYREGKKVKQRVIANLGNLEDLTPEKVEGLITSLERVCGLTRRQPAVEARKVLRWGELLALRQVWGTLGLTEVLSRLVDQGYLPFLEFLSVFRALNPQEGRAVDLWGQGFYWPEVWEKNVQPSRLSLLLDKMAAVREELEKGIYQCLSRFESTSGEAVFCLLTVTEVMPAPRTSAISHPYARYLFEETAEERIFWGVLAKNPGLPFGHHLFKGPEETGLRELCGRVAQHYGGQCIFVGDRQPTTNTLLEAVVANGYPYLIRHRVLCGRERELCLEELAAGATGFQEAAGGLLYKEMVGEGVRYLLCYSPVAAEGKNDPLAGVTLLQTNSRMNSRELVLAYWELAKVAGRITRITRLADSRDLSGELTVCVLGALLERALERLLQRAGIMMDARRALELLEELKMVVGRVNGVEIKFATNAEGLQAEILRALGIENLQALTA